jgi:hypothetical protein
MLLLWRPLLRRDPTPRGRCRRYLPFEEFVETAERTRDLKPAGLAQVMIWLQNTALHPTGNSGNNLAFGEVNPVMLLPLVTIEKA